VKRFPQFAVGPYRPIYLWGGPGTVRMNRLKFMNVTVDQVAHHEVHSPAAADRVLNQMRCNWVHLTYDWGFPPEVEQEDWDSFEQGAAAYHQAGSQVFAYIQSANCVYDGSYRQKDWYALDPRGRKITYFTYGGRYIACMGNPDWRQHLREMVRGALERGADGIFLDNLFHGSQPYSLWGAWLGAAGCYCARCRDQFREDTGQSMPVGLQPVTRAVAGYLRWRAEQVTSLVAELGAYADQLRPGTPISANDFDPVLRNSYLIYGIDLDSLAQVQDITMIENYGLARYDGGRLPRLVNNALTIRTARVLVGGAAHLSVLSYDVGIGFDDVYPLRRYHQGIAEAAACGTSMTTKGTEYHDGTQMSVLSAARYGRIQAAIGQYHSWLEANAGVFDDRRINLAPVALLFPGEPLWLRWQELAPVYFGAGQVLTHGGIPWRVVRPGDPLEGVQALLAFEDLDTVGWEQTTPPTILVSRLPGWSLRRPGAVARNNLLRGVVGFVARAGFKAYSDLRLARHLLDRLGMPKVVTQSPLYSVPGESARNTLLGALPKPIFPRVRSEKPVLIEIWRAGDRQQVHLVNYDSAPQAVQVDFGSPVAAQTLSPDGAEGSEYRGDRLELLLDVYQILLLNVAAGK